MRTLSTSIIGLAIAASLPATQLAHAEQQAAGASAAAATAAPAPATAAPATGTMQQAGSGLAAHGPAPAAAAAVTNAAAAAATAATASALTAPATAVASGVSTSAGSRTLAASAAPDKPKSKWLWPLESAKARVSSFFGALRGRRAHGGVDISTPVGTPVKATDGGVVVASTNRYEGDKKYGEVVVIEHMNGFKSLYAHLNTRDVKVGDEVVAGQSIGQSGKTGHSTGPHLHLEAFYNGARTDPKNLLAGLEESALPSALNARQYTSTDGSFVTKAPYVAPAKSGKSGKTAKGGKAGKASSSQKHIKNRAPKSSKKSGRK
jgi:murein DD-endopeptidase MepM/ murein hydrolase activator NlpD